MSCVPFFWAESPAPPIAEMDPATRATLLLALLAIVLVGVGLILMVIMGGRMVRRWSRFTPPPRAIGRPRPRPDPLDSLELDDEADPDETRI